MKKEFLWLCLIFVSCSTTQKSVADNGQVLNSYSRPFKIFSIGYWPKGYMVVTLTDVNKQYFTITTPVDTTLKVGLAYNR